MSKYSYNFSITPNISDKLSQPFSEIITSGIEVFAEENNMSLDEATALFEKKLQNVTIRTFNEQDITQNSPEDEKELRYKMGLTRCKVDPNNPNQPADKTIYINEFLLDDPNELKSTFMHEIFHLVLSDDNLTFKNGNYVYNMGCSETTFQGGDSVETKGHMLHEILVARMQKTFCKKEGLPFIEDGLFASGYAEGLKRIEKFEKLNGSKISPSSTFDNLRMIYGNDLEALSASLDIHDYKKCDEFLLEVQNKKSPISRLYHVFVDFAKEAGQKFKNLMNPKGKIPMLESGTRESGNPLLSEESHLPTLETLTPKQKFEKALSNNGEFKRLPPLDLKKYESPEFESPEFTIVHGNDEKV